MNGVFFCKDTNNGDRCRDDLKLVAKERVNRKNQKATPVKSWSPLRNRPRPRLPWENKTRPSASPPLHDRSYQINFTAPEPRKCVCCQRERCRGNLDRIVWLCSSSCESGQRCHRLNNLASTNSLHTHVTRVVSSCPVWKSSQIHEFVQLCQKQIETGRVHEQLQSEAPFLKI